MTRYAFSDGREEERTVETSACEPTPDWRAVQWTLMHAKALREAENDNARNTD